MIDIPKLLLSTLVSILVSILVVVTIDILLIAGRLFFSWLDRDNNDRYGDK